MMSNERTNRTGVPTNEALVGTLLTTKLLVHADEALFLLQPAHDARQSDAARPDAAEPRRDGSRDVLPRAGRGRGTDHRAGGARSADRRRHRGRSGDAHRPAVTGER